MVDTMRFFKTTLVAFAACALVSACMALAPASAFADEAANADAADASQGALTVSSTLQTAASKSNGLVNGHVYIVRPALNSHYALDVVGASTSSKANVQLYKSNRTNAQLWKYTVDSRGRASFTCVCSGKSLAVKGSKTKDGTNVQQNKKGNVKSQKWIVTQEAQGTYRIASALNKKKVLTVAGNKKGNGINVCIGADSSLKGQRWTFFDVTKMRSQLKAKAKKSAKSLAGKTYYIASALNRGMVLDVVGGSKKSGANVQLYRANATKAQRWTITFDKKGFATIKNASGKVLGVKDGRALSGTNVRQYTAKGSRAQKWIVSKNSDGTFSIQSALWADLMLDVKGAQTANGTNVWVYKANSTDAQKWRLTRKAPTVAGLSSSVSSSLDGIDMTGVKAVGIDVSFWNGDIDWNKVAESGISFVIIRCGYGDDYTSQDDSKFFQNVKGAKAAGLDLGVYLYSYAQRATGSESAASEAAHTLRLLKAAGLKPADLKYGVSYDIEDGSQSSIWLLPLCKAYCTAIKAAGYKVSIYSYLYWWNSKLTDADYSKWDRFIAQWGVSSCGYTGDYKIWQCTSDGSVPGISGRVDMDLAY